MQIKIKAIIVTCVALTLVILGLIGKTYLDKSEDTAILSKSELSYVKIGRTKTEILRRYGRPDEINTHSESILNQINKYKMLSDVIPEKLSNNLIRVTRKVNTVSIDDFVSKISKENNNSLEVFKYRVSGRNSSAILMVFDHEKLSYVFTVN